MAKRSNGEAPWRRSNPKKKAGKSKKLTGKQRAEARARARARKAGRRYPPSNTSRSRAPTPR